MNKFGFKNHLFGAPWFLTLFFTTFSAENIQPYGQIIEQEGVRKVFIILVFTTALILLFVNFHKILSILKGRWVYIFFLAYISASAAWSDDPKSALRISAYFWGMTAVCLMAVVAYEQHPLKFFQTLVFYSVLMIGGSLATILLFPGTSIGEDGRWLGLTTHANGLGLVSVISIWANICYATMSKSKISMLLNVSMILLSAVCIYGADSATSFVISAAILTMTLILRTFSSTRLTRLFAQITGIGFFVLLVASLLYLIQPELFNIEGLLKSIGRDTSFTGRNVIWNRALTEIYRHPIFGAGFQEFINMKNGSEIKHFHNGYLELLIRGGIIALLFVIAFIYQLVFSVKRLANPELYVYLMVMILAILAHNITESSFGRGVTAFWLVFSVIYFFRSNASKAQTNGNEASALSDSPVR